MLQTGLPSMSRITQPRITQHEVSAAAERLVSNPKGRGERDATYRSVREVLGSRGSNSTIKKMLEVWQKQRNTERLVPPELSEAAIRVLTQLWLAVAAKRQREIELPLQAKATVTLGRRPRGLSGRVAVTISMVRANRVPKQSNSYDILTKPVEGLIEEAGIPLKATEIWDRLGLKHPELQNDYLKQHFSRSLVLIANKGKLLRLIDGRWALNDMTPQQRSPRRKAPKYKAVGTSRAERRRNIDAHTDRAITVLRRRKRWMSAEDLIKTLLQQGPLIVLASPQELLTPKVLARALYMRVYHKAADIEKDGRLFRYAKPATDIAVDLPPTATINQ